MTTRIISQVILLLAIAGATAGANMGADRFDVEAASRPGHVLILTESGYVPTLRTLLPDIPFAAFKAYETWQVKSLVQEHFSKASEAKAAAVSPMKDLYLLAFPDTVSVTRVISLLRNHPQIRYVEPDYVVQLFGWPQDSLFVHQWYLHNTGQEFYAIDRLPGDSNDVLYMKQGKPGEDINVAPIYDDPPADSAQVLVAIIDSGVDYDHPDLAANIFYNPLEIPDNGVDDDHNGLVDDIRGWDFSGDTLSVSEVIGDNDPADNSIGHGTHVAGLVAAIQNEIGVVGYPGRIKILPVKILPNGFLSVSVVAIYYAADFGAKVINISWGYPFDSHILQNAIAYARDRGCLVVAAAGNFGTSMRTFPASFPETFTVGATNSDGFMTYFSSYGPFLDISAPGRNILSLRAAGTDLYYPEEPGVRIIEDYYILADGTSMSAPIVAGAAAMLWSFNPGLDAEQIMDVLRQSADDMIDPWDEGMNLPGYDTLSGWGRLNVGQAFAMIQAPAAYLTSPGEYEIVSGDVAVGVRTTGGYTGTVSLYLGEGMIPESWTLLHQGTIASDQDPLYVWNSSGYNGYFTFRLETTTGADQVSFRVISGTMVEITSPNENDEVRYLVKIEGSAYGNDFDSVVLGYREADRTRYEHLFSSTRIFYGESIFEWPIFSLDNGEHILKMEMFAGSQRYADSVSVMVFSAMRAGFPKHHPSYTGLAPGTADIDGDGAKEIAVGCYGGLYAYNHDGTLLEGFPVLTGYDLRTIPAFDDIDGDGLLDIIIAGKNVAGCYNYRGEALSGWPRTAATGLTMYSYPIPVPTELFDREDSVVVFMNKFGEVHAYRFDGDPYFYSMGGLFTSLDPNIFDTSLFTGNGLPFVTATDLDDDGMTEVVALYSTYIPSSGIYVWNGRNGLPPFDWDTPLARRIRLSHGGVLADLDEDGTLEIIASVLDTNLTMAILATRFGREDMPGWPVYLDGISSLMGISPVCVDIDGDGAKEVLATFIDIGMSRIYAFNRDGTPYVDNPGVPYGLLLTAPAMLSNIIVADINGDGVPNIVCRAGQLLPGWGYEQVFAWEPNGVLTEGFPITTPTYEVTSRFLTPIVDDLEGDGTTELIMCGDDGDLFVWDLGTAYDSAAMIWPRYLGDERNSGINPHRGQPTAVAEDLPVVPGRFTILRNFPNPFNPATTIEYNLDRAADVRLEIFNILGQKVATVVSGMQPAGVHTCVWDGTDSEGNAAASGVYFARLSDTKHHVTRKLMLLR